MRLAVFTLALLTAPATAQDGNSPPADFFVGQYRMIGLDAAGQPVDLALRLDLAPGGLAASTCDAPQAGMLMLPTAEQGDHYLEGTVAGHALTCDYFLSYENNPMLTCFGDGDTRLTLWVADTGFADPLACGT